MSNSYLNPDNSLKTILKTQQIIIMEPEPKASDSYEVDSVKDVDIVRAFGLRGTAIPGMAHNFKYDQVSEKVSLNPYERLRVPDVKLAMHSNLIQYLSIAKIFLTLIFIVGLGLKWVLFYLLFLFLDLLGFIGSITLNPRPLIIFAVVLLTSIASRVLSSGYLLSTIEFSGCGSDKYYAFESECQVYVKYSLGNLILIAFEGFQIALCVNLRKKVLGMADEKRLEMSYVLISQKIPKFICCGKLRAWKLAI